MKNSMFFIFMICLVFTGCSTTYRYSTEHENAWFVNGEGLDSFPVYCMANKTPLQATPKCFRSKLYGFKAE